MTKSDPKDPLVRNLVLLGLIPRFPRSASVQELKAALEQRGFLISARTLQRDLGEKLARRFPLICQGDGQTFRWSFDSQSQINLPATDTAAALAMHLAESHLRHVLPPGVLGLLEPQFGEARRQLQVLGNNPLAAWPRRVRAVPIGKALLPAQVDPDVWDLVGRALLEQKQLQVEYLGRGKSEPRGMRLHPKGLLSRGPVSYLVASVADYEDLRHFSLHRIRHAEVLDAAAAPDDFDIATYLPSAALTPRRGEGAVQLVADVSSQLAWTLHETPLSEDQRLEATADADWHRLRASVPDDQETMWWVLGLGSRIRVREPPSWVESLRTTASEMHQYYAV